MRIRSGNTPWHVDCNPKKGIPAIEYTKLFYYESRATNPPDKLYVGDKEYDIRPGLQVIIPTNVRHKVISKDPNSFRVFTSDDSEGNEQMMVNIILLNTTFFSILTASLIFFKPKSKKRIYSSMFIFTLSVLLLTIISSKNENINKIDDTPSEYKIQK